MKILELNHLQGLVIRLDDKGFAVQVRVEAFTCVDNRKTFTLHVGVGAYLDSVSVNDLLAYAIARESCIRTAPKPFCELSTCTIHVLSLIVSK